MGWEIIKTYPLVGIGIDAVSSNAMDFMPRNAVAHTHIAPAVPHNAFLQVGAESGLFALLFFVLLWLWALRSILLALRYVELRPYAMLFLP